VAVVVGVGAMAVLEVDRTRLVATICVLAPVAALVALVSDRSRLADASTTGAAADRAGYLLVLQIAVAVAVLLAAPGLVDRLAGRLRRIDLWWYVVAAAVLGGCLLVVLAVIPQRLRGGLTSEGYRPDYWRVAWNEYLAHPWLGSGAGTFGEYWARSGKLAVAGGALDAHNLYLETLAEVGPVGLGLLAAMLTVPVVVAVRLRGRPIVAVAAGGYLTLLVHAAFDWDCEMPAVMLAGLICGAAIVGALRDPEPADVSTRTRAALLLAALGLALFSLVTRAV
jgi:O-antigen ligase